MASTTPTSWLLSAFRLPFRKCHDYTKRLPVKHLLTGPALMNIGTNKPQPAQPNMTRVFCLYSLGFFAVPAWIGMLTFGWEAR